VGNVSYAATSDTSNISTEMMVDDDPLLDMDVNYSAPSDSPVYVGTIQSYNNEKTVHDVSLELSNEVEDPIYIASPISTQTLVDNNHILDIDATPKACNKEVKTKKLQVVEHGAIVGSEMNSMFRRARYQSEESRAIIRCAKKTSLTEVLLTIYTTYHSPFATLLFSWLEHEDLVANFVIQQMCPLQAGRRRCCGT
jgi:excinuclease UvrABC nuclease subunit